MTRNKGFTYLWKLVLEYVDFIQKQYDRCSQEPPGVDDRLKENQGLSHAILLGISAAIRDRKT